MAHSGSFDNLEKARILSEIIRLSISPDLALRFIMETPADPKYWDREQFKDWDNVIAPPGRSIKQCKDALEEMMHAFQQEFPRYAPRLETTRTLPGVSSLTAMDPVGALRHPSYQQTEHYMPYGPPPAHPPTIWTQIPPPQRRTLLPRPDHMSPQSAGPSRRPPPSPLSERPEVQAPKRGRPTKATLEKRERENEEATRAGREPPHPKSTKRTKSSRPSAERVETPQSATTPSRDVGGGTMMGTIGPGESPPYTSLAGGGKRRRLTEQPENLIATMSTAEMEAAAASATQSPALASAIQSSEPASATTAATSAPVSALITPTPASAAATEHPPPAALPSTPSGRSAGDQSGGA